MITLAQYLKEAGCESGLMQLIEIITDQANIVRQAFLEKMNTSGGDNVYGEKQAGMDVWADEHFTEVLKASNMVKELASEERSDILRFDSQNGEYAVVMDPLDGSSLLDVNLTVGSLFGIFRDSVMQRGGKLMAAFFLLYGPSTTLTLSVGKGVQIFGLEKEGKFVLLEKNVRIPDGKIYGTGGTKNTWVTEHDRCMDYVISNDYKIRYTGAGVADLQQILKYGGLYAYPATKDRPEGKIRLLFECIPFGFIVQQAGGLASNGRTNLLGIEPEQVNQRSPIYMGSKKLVEKLQEIIGETK